MRHKNKSLKSIQQHYLRTLNAAGYIDSLERHYLEQDATRSAHAKTIAALKIELKNIHRIYRILKRREDKRLKRRAKEKQ
jgi:predicted esterase YcpF (UPF0227 family)